ncbi:MAG TPA: F0F1 ATP synthase subunit B [Alphaproteobacteria bacterium]|jgi:F-type H+-transporting ATPase subunit b|nr:F0F1 ATP synthase subunit B [Alphaproteobacteria bacterium]
MAEPAHTTSTGDPKEGGHGAFPPFQSETFASQLFWLVIAFVLLYVLMTKLALPRVQLVIDNRQKHISGDLSEASRLKGESDAAVAAYEKALADARARAQEIANETREKYAAEAEATRKRLEDQLNAKLADAEKTIAGTKQSAMKNVHGIAADAAKAIVERLIGTAPTDSAVNAAVEDTLKS